MDNLEKLNRKIVAAYCEPTLFQRLRNRLKSWLRKRQWITCEQSSNLLLEELRYLKDPKARPGCMTYSVPVEVEPKTVLEWPSVEEALAMARKQ